jgi:hypothetical protein
MEQVRTYLLSVIAAAVICSLVTAIPGKSGSISSVLKLMTGIFMAVTVLSPLVPFQLPNIQSYMDTFHADAITAVSAGQHMADSDMRQIIKSRVEAYILDKAAAYGVDLTVEVSLTDDEVPVPCGVKLSGAVSPYAKLTLSNMLVEDLGIRKEEQIWTD